MLKKTEEVGVRYKPHGILRRMMEFDSEEVKQVFDCWQFESHKYSIDFGEDDLIYVLDELSIEGWEVVCPLADEDGYLLRTIDFKDDTIIICGDDEEIN